MGKVFKKANYKNVAGVVLYLSAGALYYDEDFEKPVEYREDAIELFMNGAVIYIAGEGYFRPDSVSEDGSFAVGENATDELPERPEPEYQEDVHTIPPNKWNDDISEPEPDPGTVSADPQE